MYYTQAHPLHHLQILVSSNNAKSVVNAICIKMAIYMCDMRYLLYTDWSLMSCVTLNAMKYILKYQRHSFLWIDRYLCVLGYSDEVSLQEFKYNCIGTSNNILGLLWFYEINLACQWKFQLALYINPTQMIDIWMTWRFSFKMPRSTYRCT